MTIPALSTLDKSFICSYTLGFNIHPILASGIMNEITIYTTEYIEGACWIPVLAPKETSDHSYFWDEFDKDVVYVKVGCRVSIDGYIHAWLLSNQKTTELILWNNNASYVDTPITDTTTLHWAIEKIYRQVIGNTSTFVRTNVKFQTYVTGADRLYLCGVNSTATIPNIILDPSDVKASSVAWFPNNTIVNVSDLLTSNNDSSSPKCSTTSTYHGELGISTVAMKTSPSFWYITTDHPGSMNIYSVCVPGDAGYAWKAQCTGNTVTFLGIGNNSGRSYTMIPYDGICIGCNPDLSNGGLACDLSPNQAYILVPGYCSGASGSNQTECEANGGTWIPQHYECDPSFIYDTSVSFVYRQWNSISPTISDFAAGRFYFSSLDDGHSHYMQASYMTTSFIDMFSEYEDDDHDWLKHFSFVPYIHYDWEGNLTPPPYNNYFYTKYVKIIGIGVLTNNNGATISSADWIITWSGVNYFDSWIAPDGLTARDPGSSEPMTMRPVTHHEEFYIGATAIEGGFLYETGTSNGFLSRDPGVETRTTKPQHYNTEFNFLYKTSTSDAFLDRTIDPETKTNLPQHYNTEFSWITQSVLSDAFLERTISEEIKTEIPLCYNTEFNWLYKMVEPTVSKYRFLKTAGDDTLDGKTWANAWQHWSHAMSTVKDDAKLFAMDGHYNNETHPSPQKPFELVVCDTAGTDETPGEVKITKA